MKEEIDIETKKKMNQKMRLKISQKLMKKKEFSKCKIC